MKKTLLLAIALLFPLSAAAQSGDRAEIGTTLGLQFNISAGSSMTTFGTPGGGGSLGTPSLYASFFLTPNLILEPQLGLSHQSADGFSLTSIHLAPQLAYLFTPETDGSLYSGFNLGLDYASGFGESASQLAVGAAVGYRHRFVDSLGLRFEFRFRRWFESDLFWAVSEISFLVGVGAIIR